MIKRIIHFFRFRFDPNYLPNKIPKKKFESNEWFLEDLELLADIKLDVFDKYCDNKKKGEQQ